MHELSECEQHARIGCFTRHSSLQAAFGAGFLAAMIYAKTIQGVGGTVECKESK